MLSMLCHGLRSTGASRDKFPDQEVFLIGTHGSRLYIFRGGFPGRKTSLIYTNRFIHPDGRIEIVPRGGKEGEGTHPTHTLITPAGNRYAHAQHTCPNEPIKDISTFYIRGSREYDLWHKADFQDAVKLLVALDLYLMSGNAKCGVLQRVFAENPITDDIKEGKEVTDEEINEAKLQAETEMTKLQREEDRFRDKERRRSDDARAGPLKALDTNRFKIVVINRVNGTIKGSRRPGCDDKVCADADVDYYDSNGENDEVRGST